MRLNKHLEKRATTYARDGIDIDVNYSTGLFYGYVKGFQDQTELMFKFIEWAGENKCIFSVQFKTWFNTTTKKTYTHKKLFNVFLKDHQDEL